jgi:hypothetical protein
MVTTKINTIWSEIDPRFIPDSKGLLKVVSNIDSVLAGIDNILKTRKGERAYLPEFGSILPDIVFEPLTSTTVKLLRRSLKEDIERWDDRVVVENVDFYFAPDTKSLSISLYFRIRGANNIFKYEGSFRGN